MDGQVDGWMDGWMGVPSRLATSTNTARTHALRSEDQRLTSKGEGVVSERGTRSIPALTLATAKLRPIKHQHAGTWET